MKKRLEESGKSSKGVDMNTMLIVFRIGFKTLSSTDNPMHGIKCFQN